MINIPSLSALQVLIKVGMVITLLLRAVPTNSRDGKNRRPDYNTTHRVRRIG
ncbi:MAG: hypothetical protein KatS3mg074_899 [Meiothermus sp.]|uniref:Uncharacterized protein n=1 Tax=Meiothermus hypogaeus TaxID=884155 RepID=A0ABX9MK27_9DEIN|nr:hypothetical protein Mhypo_02379 [Meiothermus hypogaeus]GIW38501.1 MAG: hypothetical protein KatS3mg074_899 [Meiothermus sp.]